MSDQPVQPAEHEDETGLFEDAETTENRVPVTSQLMVVAVILLGIFGTGFLPKVLTFFNNEEVQSATIPLSAQPESHTETEFKVDQEPNLEPFNEISLRAESAFVWDVAKQRMLYEKQPDRQLPLASITKLMTALVAHEILADNTPVSIPLAAILQDGESGFTDGERFSLSELSDLTLMNSSNDGAFAMAAAAGAALDSENPAETFVRAMNIRAEELGLSQTYYLNPTGLDLSKTEAGAFGSARDVAFLVQYILEEHPEILDQTTVTNARVYDENGDYFEGENTNQYVNDIPGLIGSKTGYTELAGGNLAIAFDASVNHPIVVVVLNSTTNGRFTDILALSNAARAAIQ